MSTTHIPLGSPQARARFASGCTFHHARIVSGLSVASFTPLVPGKGIFVFGWSGNTFQPCSAYFNAASRIVDDMSLLV